MKSLILIAILLSGCAVGDGPDRYDWIDRGISKAFINANKPGGVWNPIHIQVDDNRRYDRN
jgi:hypothetical protein